MPRGARWLQHHLRRRGYLAGAGKAIEKSAEENKGYQDIDKDRIEGAAKQARGAVKQAVGKVVGDAKLQTEGKADQAEGKLQNAVGGLKDAIRKA